MKMLLAVLSVVSCVRTEPYVDYDFRFDYPESGEWICEYRDTEFDSSDYNTYRDCTHTKSKIINRFMQVPISVPVFKIKSEEK